MEQKVNGRQMALTGPKSHWKGKQPGRDHLYSAGLLILVLIVGAMSIIAWMNGAEGWFDLNRITLYLSGLGILAPMVYILLRVVGVMIMLPSLPLDAVGGAVFGPFGGTFYSVLGAEGGALLSFFIARALGREAIARLLGKDIVFCDLCAERHLFYVIIFARLLPMVSFDLVSYGAGLARISIGRFALATLLGMIPFTFAVSYFGRGFLSPSGYTLLFGALLVFSFFLVPIWIKRRNPWGLYVRITQRSTTQ